MVLAIVSRSLAGLVTAVSPCVLPVLPIVLAGGVGANKRRPFAIIAGLAPLVLRLDPLRNMDPRQARPAEGPVPQHLDRAALPNRSRARRPAGRHLDRAGHLAPAHAASVGRPRRRVPPRLRARLRLRAVRRGCACATLTGLRRRPASSALEVDHSSRSPTRSGSPSCCWRSRSAAGPQASGGTSGP